MRVVISLGQRDLGAGFPHVTAEMRSDGNLMLVKVTGRLTTDREISLLYRRWQQLYEAFYKRLGLRRSSVIEIEEEDATNFSDVEFRESCQQLQEIMNCWLDTKEFRHIDQQLRSHLNTSEEVRVIIETDDDLLQRLPWQHWDLFTDYRQAEIALSPLECQPPQQDPPRIPRSGIRILAVLGHSAGINIQEDRRLLENLPDNAETKFLVEPERPELDKCLWDEAGWDILFFAGHSQTEGETGTIEINPRESLAISDLSNALRKAIERGLQLAIFNSCDGLGIARYLADLHIPQMVVMREPVPDKVAQEFLKNFLAVYSSGKSLYTSVREARERLQGLEGNFPCASWLPVIFQNPAAEVPLDWIRLQERTGEQAGTKPPPLLKRCRFHTMFLASVAVTSLVLVVRYLGWLQPLELKAYDQMMQLRPDEGRDPRILVVGVEKRDINVQDPKERGEFSLSNARLVQVINKLNKYQPQVIGLDMYRDESPLSSNVKPTADLEKLFQENENLFAVCKVNEPMDDIGGEPPAPFIPSESLGFSDVEHDSASNLRDQPKMIRRHLLYMNPDPSSSCKADYSLNLLLAGHYLHTQNNIQLKKKSDTEFDLGKAHFKKLPSNAGGYQGLDNRGFQILLNYRTRKNKNVANSFDVTNLNSFNVTELLTLRDDVLASFIKDKIILIGVTEPVMPDPDDFQTPYGTQIRGVFLHAQMVSQLISAALGERPLLGVWSWWADSLWICGWSFVGGLIVWLIWGAIPVGVAITVAIAILSGSCFLLFVGGNWVPFVPSLLTLASSSGILICYTIYKKSTINT